VDIREHIAAAAAAQHGPGRDYEGAAIVRKFG
jgi:hypothetical protein